MNSEQRKFQDHATFSLTLAALGVVFGDIGTSPLYAIREAFHGEFGVALNEINILGVLSLIIWSLIIVICFKYLFFVMRAHNDGEGGVLALTSLLFTPNRQNKNLWKRIMISLGLFGSALLVGDGMITPAISILSAVEGLNVATPILSPYVIPLTLIILTLLFSGQHFGTKKIGKLFGVIVFFWFITITLLGLRGISMNFRVLKAFNPYYCLNFFLQNGFIGITVMGAVFLAVTGGETLYADMGHFGKKPIHLAWFFIAFPAILINYLGQGALLLVSPNSLENPFYELAPSWALYPLVAMATLATIVASQAVISGVFSLTYQAIHMGYSPRFRILHTSRSEKGQVYIPKLNWFLYISTILLVLGFGSSSNLASAYGIAISLTMVITTLLACTVARIRWNWSPWVIGIIFLFFISVDLLYLGANLGKISAGGWFPLTVATFIFIILTTWHKGVDLLNKRLKKSGKNLNDLIQEISAMNLNISPGQAIFLTKDPTTAPMALISNIEFNNNIHEKNIILSILRLDKPYVAHKDRIEIHNLSDKFISLKAYYGFMETPSVKEISLACKKSDLDFDYTKMIYFLSLETLIVSKKDQMALWREKLFSFLAKNSESAAATFEIPPNQVVEIGRQIKL